MAGNHREWWFSASPDGRGAKLPPGYQFGSPSGMIRLWPLEATYRMFCHSCGAQVPPDVQFCPNCGQPLAAVPPPAAVVPAFVPAGQVSARPGAWISAGWTIVTGDLANYVVLTLIFIVLNAIVPIILQGPMMAGFHIYTIKRLLGRQAEFGDIFKGFNFFVPALVAFLIILVFTFFGGLLCIIPGLVIAAMYKFTYLFIVDKKMDFWPAMQASHNIVKQDYFGFTMFLLLAALVNILGALCCVVGILVTIPMTFAAITVAYQELVGFDPLTPETL